jgi:iron complex outermembrane receptor protein
MKVQRTPIASAVALALMGMIAAAQAQQVAQAPAAAASAARSDDTQTVVVTGIRAALQQSLTQKRNSDSHVEVITAEDIGKMPDKNVADSLQRVPGVTISSAGANEGGFDENDRVSMRGTGPSLTQTLINGHNVATGDWFVLNQSGTVGRSVSYTLLPSELVQSVIVHKTSEASLVEGGVTGSVDIVTRRPLAFPRPLTMEASVGAVHASLPSKTDPQFSGLINWKNDANTMGVLFQLFSEKRHLRRDGQEILSYGQFAADSNVVLGNNGQTAHPDLAGVYYPGLIGSAFFEQERKREGGLIDVQIKPTNDLTLDFSAFASKLTASNYNRNYLLWGSHFVNNGGNCDAVHGCAGGADPLGSGSPGQAPDAGYVIHNGTLVSANFTGAPGTQYGVYDQISRPKESADTNYFTFDGKWRANDALSFTTQLGTSEGHGKTPHQDVAEWNTGVGSGAGWGLHGLGGAADWNLGTANNASPAGLGLGWIFGYQDVNIKDKENWGQADGTYRIDSGMLSSLTFGVRHAEHTRDSGTFTAQGPIGCCDATNPASAFDPVNFPSGFQLYPGNFGSGLGGTFPRDIWFYSPAQLAAYNAAFANRDPVTRRDWSAEYYLKEKSTAGYVQANMDGHGWSGNVGVRLVRTQEHVITNVGVPNTAPGAITSSAFGAFLPTPTDHTYNDVLPSANLKVDLNKDMVARFAISRTMARPDFSALAGAVTLNQTAASGSGGNPDLKPVRSTNLDATLEYYFAPRSLASIGLFYMDLTSFVDFGTVHKSFLTFDQNNPNGFMMDYALTVPTNTKGKVKGIELAYEQPLFGNFGVAANYTYTDAKRADGGPLVGASKNLYNLVGYYEDDRFSFRLAYNYRSKFYSGLDRSVAFSQDNSANLSASLGYKVNDHLSITLDGRNLNDPTLKYYALNEDQPRAFYKNGRQYFLNARFKF